MMMCPAYLADQKALQVAAWLVTFGPHASNERIYEMLMSYRLACGFHYLFKAFQLYLSILLL